MLVGIAAQRPSAKRSILPHNVVRHRGGRSALVIDNIGMIKLFGSAWEARFGGRLRCVSWSRCIEVALAIVGSITVAPSLLGHQCVPPSGGQPSIVTLAMWRDRQSARWHRFTWGDDGWLVDGCVCLSIPPYN